MLALITVLDLTIVGLFAEGARVQIPDADLLWVEPAENGWTNGVVRFATIAQADDVPEGKIATGQTVEMIDGEPKWINTLADYVEPVPAVISDRQFFQRLAMPPYELITQAEALAAVKTGDIPYAMINLISALPEASRFPAEMLLSGATEFKRDHPLTATLGLAFGWDEAQVDQFWRDAAAI